MSILYLDFERYNDSKQNIKSEAVLNFSTSIKQNQYQKIALTKLDIDVNNLYCLRCPLLQPQEYKDSSSYIKNYDMKDSSNNYIFNHDNGWFETIYSFVLIYKNGGSLVAEEFPFLYKSEETDFNYASIGKREKTTGFYEYDNFNDYFLCNTPFNFLNSLNVSLKYAISNRLGISDTQIIELMPNFTNDTTRLIINNFSYGNNNDMQPDNNDILQVQYPEEVDDGTYPGSNHSTPGPMFCFGINKEAKDLLYHGLVNKKYSKDNAIFPNPLSQDYYFLKLDMILETSLTIPSVSNASTKYNITAQYQEEAYDKLLDIKSIVVRSNNIPMPPLFQNKKPKDFLLSNSDTQILNYYSQDTLFKLSPNWNTIFPQRLIYNNTAITNNFSALIGGLNNQQYSLSIEFIDKYNNNYEATLGLGQKLYAQIAIFN